MITVTPYVEVSTRLLRDQLDSFRHMLPMLTDEEGAGILRGIIERTEEQLRRLEGTKRRASS
jgi:hypothetical protein